MIEEEIYKTPLSSTLVLHKSQFLFFFLFQVGLAVGSLCVIEGAAYLVDLILSFLHFAKNQGEFLE